MKTQSPEAAATRPSEEKETEETGRGRSKTCLRKGAMSGSASERGEGRCEITRREEAP